MAILTPSPNNRQWLCLAVAQRDTSKDSLRNVLETEEFVVNIVVLPLAMR